MVFSFEHVESKLRLEQITILKHKQHAKFILLFPAARYNIKTEIISKARNCIFPTLQETGMPQKIYRCKSANDKAFEMDRNPRFAAWDTRDS